MPLIAQAGPTCSLLRSASCVARWRPVSLPRGSGPTHLQPQHHAQQNSREDAGEVGEGDKVQDGDGGEEQASQQGGQCQAEHVSAPL